DQETCASAADAGRGSEGKGPGAWNPPGLFSRPQSGASQTKTPTDRSAGVSSFQPALADRAGVLVAEQGGDAVVRAAQVGAGLVAGLQTAAEAVAHADLEDVGVDVQVRGLDVVVAAEDRVRRVGELILSSHASRPGVHVASADEDVVGVDVGVGGAAAQAQLRR